MMIQRTETMTAFMMAALAVAACVPQAQAFVSTTTPPAAFVSQKTMLFSAPTATTSNNFIGTELRDAAMKLHTREQAPQEGKAATVEREPHTTTHDDYLRFLVDSQHVYRQLEIAVNELEGLAVFRNTGLERVDRLEQDIDFMTAEYGLERPEVGTPGKEYAAVIEKLSYADTIPQFMCHFYNHYFAHTAGGRMIGKKMSSLLLEKKTLEFYKWDGDVNKMKVQVKQDIEDMVASWTREQKDACVNETAAAFRGGGSLNSNLAGAHGKQ